MHSAVAALTNEGLDLHKQMALVNNIVMKGYKTSNFDDLKVRLSILDQFRDRVAFYGRPVLCKF